MTATTTITSAQMRALEQAAMASGAVTGLELMERAGRGVVDVIHAEWPGATRAVVLCGPGNNGGDGFVIARLLHDAGLPVQVFVPIGFDALFDGTEGGEGDAWDNARAWCERGTVRRTPDSLTLCQDGETIILVDALLGIGQNRPADAILESYWDMWDTFANVSPDTDVHCVSVDIPTGYDTDTGALLAKNPFEPDIIVTFHQPKPVHKVLEQHGYRIIVKDIGL
ncbi:NAD(P)H-hydrate epimerase [Litoreibacter ponti]|uniref:NAD(P)H-hydrate epimerase n=1 Tax=Litoreibacter ponti TaxID=1510457 RepID=UPI001FE4D727|nr:NAD(P)H-hydrate epimerase [Litoreibacter ponti]